MKAFAGILAGMSDLELRYAASRSEATRPPHRRATPLCMGSSSHGGALDRGMMRAWRPMSMGRKTQ